MAFSKNTLANVVASSILVINNFSGLIFSPYKTMRKVSLHVDFQQIGIIFFLVFTYYYLVSLLTNHNFANSLFFLCSFALTVSFFYISGKILRADVSFNSLISTWAFSLLPTLLWFSITLILFLLLPPPRTTSILGTSFSMVYIGISLIILWWKITLMYLSIRFSLKTDFWMTLFLMIIYGVWFLPYTYALYFFSVSRVPFI